MIKARHNKIGFDSFNLFILCLIVVFVIFIAINFIFKPFDRESVIIGDRICGNLDGELRDSCCSEIHANDSAVTCLGQWKYSDGCSFVCYSESELSEKRCSAVNGKWFEFPNGCVDSCELTRNPETISCTQSLTFSCDCGPSRCWNGESCEDN